jgi:peptide-methionine (R)-S-oxide reductase
MSRSARDRAGLLRREVLFLLGATLIAPGARADSGVIVVPIGVDGQPGAPERRPKFVLSEREWRARLSPIAFTVTREEGTERAFTGALWNQHEPGIYRCAGCDLGLFSSADKYESGTGWPSFTRPIAAQNVVETRDDSFGMMRTAVSCRLCDSHLGHVFPDGPRPTGLRYCMNSAAMRFLALART